MAKQDVSIEALVSRIERGEIKLPELQRGFVWQKTRVRDLLDSLYRGYPSGSILTWETNEKVETREFAIEQEPSESHFQLLLDGQQRLTCLSAILRGVPIRVKDRKTPIDILFNLEHPEQIEVNTEVNENESSETSYTDGEDVSEATEQEILETTKESAFVVSSTKLASLPNWVSVTELFKETDNGPFLKRAGVTSFDAPKYGMYAERLTKLRAISKYQYRVDVLEHNKSYEEVTEIFVRVNSLGTKLRGSDLALAKITAIWRNSLKQFMEFEDNCKKKGFDVGLGLLIRNLVSFASGSCRFKAVENLSKQQLQEGWKAAKAGFNYAMNFLKNNVGIDSQILLSSPFLLIAIAYFSYVKNNNLSIEEASKLRYWVLSANVKGRYSRGSTDTYLDRDLGLIKGKQNVDSLIESLLTQVGRLEVNKTDLMISNSNSAYFKTMFLAFKDQSAQDWRDQLGISFKHSGRKHKLHIHHIFAKDLLHPDYPKEMIDDISNLSFLAGPTNIKISNKEPIDYLPEIVETSGEGALTSQAIPTDKSLWYRAKYEEFLDKRRELIAKSLNAFIGRDRGKDLSENLQPENDTIKRPVD